MIFLPEPIGDTLTPFKTGMIVIVDGLMLAWLLVPLVRADRRAIHDLAAGSVVVRARPTRNPEDRSRIVP